MQESDIDRVAEIERLVQTHPWSRQQFQESLTFYQCTVYEKANQVVGFCILQPVLDEANLLLMAIHPNQQGKGFGYELLALEASHGAWMAPLSRCASSGIHVRM